MEDDEQEAPFDYSVWEGKTVQEILEEGQRVLLIRLVADVRSGRASHQREAILRNLLRDNGLMLGLPAKPMSPEQFDQNVADLPDFQDPVYN